MDHMFPSCVEDLVLSGGALIPPSPYRVCFRLACHLIERFFALFEFPFFLVLMGRFREEKVNCFFFTRAPCFWRTLLGRLSSCPPVHVLISDEKGFSFDASAVLFCDGFSTGLLSKPLFLTFGQNLLAPLFR